MRTPTLLASLSFLLAACASRPGADGPGVDGQWGFQVATGASITNGRLTLARESGSHTGTLTTDQGNNILRVSSVTMKDQQLVVSVESPNGQVTFRGVLSPDRKRFLGTVTYFNGQQFPMVGDRL